MVHVGITNCFSLLMKCTFCRTGLDGDDLECVQMHYITNIVVCNNLSELLKLTLKIIVILVTKTSTLTAIVKISKLVAWDFFMFIYKYILLKLLKDNPCLPQCCILMHRTISTHLLALPC